MPTILALGALLAAPLLPAPAPRRNAQPPAKPQYTLLDLGTLPSSPSPKRTARNSEAVGINDRGEVVGVSEIWDLQKKAMARRAFIWEKGKMRDANPTGKADTDITPCGITNTGTVYGYVRGGLDRPASDIDRNMATALWADGKVSKVPAFSLPQMDSYIYGGSPTPVAYLRQMGDDGTLAGVRVPNAPAENAENATVTGFVVSGGKAIEIGDLLPAAINSTGQVLCYRDEPWAKTSPTDETGWNWNPARTHFFVWDHGKVWELGTLPRLRLPQPLLYNAQHRAVIDLQAAYIPPKFPPMRLDRFGRCWWLDGVSTPIAMNDKGDVIGGGTSGPVVYTNDHTFRLQDSLIISAGWKLQRVTGINTVGQIVGIAERRGVRHAVLLTPARVATPEKVETDKRHTSALNAEQETSSHEQSPQNRPRYRHNRPTKNSKQAPSPL